MEKNASTSEQARSGSCLPAEGITFNSTTVTPKEKLGITPSRIRCQNGSFAKEECRNVVVFKH